MIDFVGIVNASESGARLGCEPAKGAASAWVGDLQDLSSTDRLSPLL